MSFGSPGFLFVFFPVFFLIYYVAPASARNLVLLIASLLFYYVDAEVVTLVLMASILINQLFGRALQRTQSASARRALLWSGIAINMVPLIYYKYWNFLITVSNDTAVLMARDFAHPLAQIILPAGISFFTFQGLSYLADIYRREIEPAKSIIDFGMYHTLFPQLIAGPIVRYAEVSDRIRERPIGIDDIEAGIIRFCWGLGKKIIIADSMGAVADPIFSLGPDRLTAAAAWLGAIAYTLQIYFDFSGYSDMAIGLGRMLGFRFPENFNHPYRSLSITEFWRRWHMTLSRWFRDYLYIPMGGNRGGPLRTYRNLFLVFALCGLWHGAAYSFLLWGVYHGVLLVIERFLKRRSEAPLFPAALRWPLTMLLVMLGWVIFRSPDVHHAVMFASAMAGLAPSAPYFSVEAVLTPDKATFLVAGVILSLLPIGPDSPGSAASSLTGPLMRSGSRIMSQVLAIVLLVYSSMLIAANGFNPFIYFRF